MLSSLQCTGHTYSVLDLRQVYVQSNEAQHAPRQLKVKSLIKHYKLEAFCILLSAESLIFHFLLCACTCVKTKENGITSHCLSSLVFTQSLFLSCTMAFLSLYNYFLQDTKETPFKEDCKLLPVLLQQQ